MGIPLLFNEEFEVVIMIEVVTEETHGSDRVPDLEPITRRALVGRAKAKATPTAKASTRAKWRSSECTDWCASKVLDTADIVRDEMLRQLRDEGVNGFFWIVDGKD